MEHPLQKFMFCPVCGSKHFVVNNFKSKRCQDCGFTYYANPCSATAAWWCDERRNPPRERSTCLVALSICTKPWKRACVAKSRKKRASTSRTSAISSRRPTSTSIVAWASIHLIWTFLSVCMVTPTP